MNTTSNINQTEETSEQFNLTKSPNAIYSLEDFRARLFQLQDEEQGSTPKIHEVLSFLKSAESSVVKESHMYSLKTSKDSSTMMEEEPLQLSSQVWMNWGMTSNGNVLTARISESRRTGNEYSLSDILEENPDPKYFLSESALQRMLSKTNDKKLLQEKDIVNHLQGDLFEQPTGDETTSEM